MKTWLAKLFGKGSPPSFPVVWDAQRPAIYALLLPTMETLAPLSAEQNPLIDPPLGESQEIRWAPGALDGVAIHHFGLGSDDDPSGAIAIALEKTLRYRQPADTAALYRLLNAGSPLSYIDELLTALPARKNVDAAALNELVVWLAMNSPDANVVKTAMALLAFFPSPQSQQILTVLGRHDEFTLYAIVALRSFLAPEDYERVWFEMAQRVDGWGRIHLIERIPEEPGPEVRHWLLRSGYSNSVMYEYTAWDCAFYGQLLEALKHEQDDALLCGAAEIFQAIMAGEPGKGIDYYSDAPEAFFHYLTHLVAQPAADPLHYLATHDIREQAEDSEFCDDDLRHQLMTLADRVMAQSQWNTAIEQALAGDDAYRFNLAIRASRLRNQEPWPAIYRKQMSDSQASHWYQLMQTDDVENIVKVVELAQQQFDLTAIASGPALNNGIGVEWRAHNAFDFVLQDLKRFPGIGWEVLNAGLQSPVIRNRNMAINALQEWQPEQLHPHRAFLEHCLAGEPDESVRERMEALVQRACVPHVIE